jgi:hypothetical protein
MNKHPESNRQRMTMKNQPFSAKIDSPFHQCVLLRLRCHVQRSLRNHDDRQEQRQEQQRGCWNNLDPSRRERMERP